jgi:AbrB family looped-hinge helix DNA binding protein
METTKLSTRGQVVIPKDLRQIYRWQSGQELEVIDTGDGVLLKTKPSNRTASWDEVTGCLSHLAKGKPAPTDDQIRAAVHQMAARRYRKSVEQ